ncbi:hypothetical protein MYIN104542_15700 [Mycobacterium intermedium]
MSTTVSAARVVRVAPAATAVREETAVSRGDAACWAVPTALTGQPVTAAEAATEESGATAARAYGSGAARADQVAPAAPAALEATDMSLVVAARAVPAQRAAPAARD